MRMTPFPIHVGISITYNKTINNFTLPEADKDKIAQLQSSVQKALEVSVKDEVSLLTGVTATVSSFKPEGSLQTTKITNNPTEEELALVKIARGNNPFNSITNVRITRNEKGNVTSLSWDEN